MAFNFDNFGPVVSIGEVFADDFPQVTVLALFHSLPAAGFVPGATMTFVLAVDAVDSIGGIDKTRDVNVRCAP